MKQRRQHSDNDSVAVFTGGGTGGHVYPAIALFENLPIELRSRVIWIGSKSGVEREIVTGTDIPYRGVATGKLRRYFSLRNLTDPFCVIAGFFQARKILKQENVCAVFSKGGFVAVPVVVAAWTLRIPIAIHESDREPGLATRITAPFSTRIFTSAPVAPERLYPSARARIVVTGNPIRRAMIEGSSTDALAAVGLQESGKPVLLVIGGSLGARQINELVWESLQSLCERAVVVHQTGRGNPVPATARAGTYVHRAYFGKELGDLYARADLIVSRAGAGSLAEIAANRIPAVLLPLGAGVSRGDQIRNADDFARAGAAIVLDSEDVDGTLFRDIVVGLLDDHPRRESMRNAYARTERSDGASTIVEWIVGQMTERS